MSIQSQLSMLINLANIDHDFADDERNMIYTIGKANGVPEREIDALVNDPVPIPHFSQMSDDEKFEYLYNVVQLMKIDKQVYLSEVKYCEEVAEKLGFKKTVIAELSSKIYSDPAITSDREALRETVMKYKN